MPPRPCPDPTCGIAQSLDVLGERWALLVVRDAFLGRTRFSEFRASLGVSPDVLTTRLATLVEYGVLERQTYREPGERERDEYVLTPAGRELAPVLAALGRWGNDHRPVEGAGTRLSYRAADTDEPLRLAFVDPAGRAVAPSAVRVERRPVAAP
ncbi:HxlR family transcriptional regulator [Frondihabitans sp. PhB188]|uniref:winged helix-turn-helix transcriptional regulator n=1 Tax=Frondihabitans sp. PhB188 TaxID=2485200 RepID=UPI000F48919A|nr:helix-turn-helix domain-containing protein [Frondihabitans sp. PhB188]ROQ40661.1 HxlR family transcriptional regulator [Frondihabitans sp. PhB188]